MVVAEADQRRHPQRHAPHIAAITNRVEQSADLVVVPGRFPQAPCCLPESFQPLPRKINDLSHRVALQELVPFLGSEPTHVGDRRMSLRNRLTDLVAERINFAGEIIDHRCDVMGDAGDLVFVLVGEKLPDFFNSRQRIADT
ncbi:hypothetical protein A4G28_13620 [Mycobacterium ostraviense]|uniref:Uncharacterized protein n=1 Tax=Mycobacterium ostraviense TaxID=2738409 RepID=A0A163WIP2_9MYCO|nr:hypothetical protein A4G28_13620 [Mycobacterium ostraviense]